MRILVTGGTGFIGSHVADALVARGHEVTVLDDLSTGRRENVPKAARFVEGSITDATAERLVDELAPAAIIHHAAQMDVRHSVERPLFDAETNVLGTLRLAHAAAEAGTRVFVMASTGGAIYGEQEVFPAPETHRTAPASPYGLSKLCGELYLGYFARTAGLRAVCLRYANVYGPRQNPHGEAGVVAIFTKRMLAGEPPVIFGDGRQTRDYVFVDDVVRANLLALDKATAAGPYNIGTGIETDVITLAGRLAAATGHKKGWSFAEGKAGEQRRSVLDSKKAAAELGWRPEVGLDEGLGRTVKAFGAG